jgi:hypothetical protein
MRPVDVLTILAPGEAVRPEALAALSRQGSIRVHHYFAEGRPLPGESRVETIARARNLVKSRGNSDLALFLDRDVVLPDCGLEHLAAALEDSPAFGALGIDYGAPQTSPGPHVAMGALMFRRPVLEQLRIRSEPGVCECECCCADLRAMGYQIDYLKGLRAEHLRARLSF